MKKTFRLSRWQFILIKDSHPLYNDILIATLVGQDIYPIVKDALIKMGYIHKVPIDDLWYDSTSKVHKFLNLNGE